MKYTCTTIIDLPLNKVIELWKDESKFAAWQDGFESIELLSGTPNKKGAKSSIVLTSKRGKIELLETILESNLPHEKTALYEHKHMTNTQTTRFKELGDNRTQYLSEVEYTQFNGFMIKLMARMFPGKFKEQSQKWLNQFKEFAETYGS